MAFKLPKVEVTQGVDFLHDPKDYLVSNGPDFVHLTAVTTGNQSSLSWRLDSISGGDFGVFHAASQMPMLIVPRIHSQYSETYMREIGRVAVKLLNNALSEAGNTKNTTSTQLMELTSQMVKQCQLLEECVQVITAAKSVVQIANTDEWANYKDNQHAPLLNHMACLLDDLVKAVGFPVKKLDT